MKITFLSFILIFYSSILNTAEFIGKFEQGSFIIGKTQKGSKVQIDNRNIRITKDGYFAFGLDRDRKNNVVIKIVGSGNKISNLKSTVFKKSFLL